MAQNITLLGVDYADSPGVQLPKTGGGLALFSDTSIVDALAGDVRSGKKIILANGSEATGTYAWDFRGDKVEQMDFTYSTDFTLGSTGFATWEPSKTASSIKATSNVGTFVADFTQYEYLTRWQCQFTAAYVTGATLKYIPIKIIAEIWQGVFKRPNSITNIRNNNYNANAAVTLFTAPLTEYYNGNGVDSYAFSASYGVYPGATAMSFSNSTSNTPTVTIKSPTWSARCSDTYMTVARASDLDQTNSIIKVKCDLFRLPVGSTLRTLYKGVIDFFNNPI